MSFKLDGAKSLGLHAVQLKGMIEPAAKVVVVTTACHSGGWMFAGDFNRTMATAAVRDEPSMSWPLLEPLRLAGTVFVSAFVKTLTPTASPFFSTGRPDQDGTELPLQSSLPTGGSNAHLQRFLSLDMGLLQGSHQIKQHRVLKSQWAQSHLRDAEDMRANLKECIFNHDTQALAELFANHTCPGDWDRGPNGAHLGVLILYAKGIRAETPESPIEDP
ncbi:hypothetical protein GGR50DRAFT_703819 [Xylaria sp. CBS 124048]|nr:hypothetical protein GGR50DRAFT_703819 [Xylaria sp. CBS 124048]